MTVETPQPELGAWLARNREPLIRRWLEIVIERSTLEELAARPFAELVRELDLLLEAARGEAPERGGGPLERAVAESAAGGAFALLLLVPPDGPGPPPESWTGAVAEVTRDGERAVGLPDGSTGVLAKAADAAEAGIAADRIRVGAWQLLGGRTRLPAAATALHPSEAADAAGLLAAARARLAPTGDAGGSGDQNVGDAEAAGGAARGAGPQLLRSLDRWAEDEGRQLEPADGPARQPDRAERDLWRELARERRGGAAEAERPPAPVTPLYPQTLD